MICEVTNYLFRITLLLEDSEYEPIVDVTLYDFICSLVLFLYIGIWWNIGHIIVKLWFNTSKPLNHKFKCNKEVNK